MVLSRRLPGQNHFIRRSPLHIATLHRGTRPVLSITIMWIKFARTDLLALALDAKVHIESRAHCSSPSAARPLC